jgi:hypothetical protein
MPRKLRIEYPGAMYHVKKEKGVNPYIPSFSV